METFLENIDQKIAALKADLERLEIGRAVYIEVNGVGSPSPVAEKAPVVRVDTTLSKTANGKHLDLRGKTVKEAVQTILAETGTAMHCKDIFNRAVLRGCRGRDGPAKLDTFASILSRDKERFVSVGRGMYEFIVAPDAGANGTPVEAE